MKIQMVIRVSGTRNGLDWPTPGETLDVPTSEAESLISGGLAKPVGKDTHRVEAAVTAPPETATTKGLSKGSTGL